MSTHSVPPSTGLDLDDQTTLRWKLHCLDLALEGLIHGPNAVETADLRALQELVDELIDLAPWPGGSA